MGKENAMTIAETQKVDRLIEQLQGECKQLNVTAQNKKCAEKSGDVSMMQLTTHFIISYFYETSILQISKIDEKKKFYNVFTFK